MPARRLLALPLLLILACSGPHTSLDAGPDGGGDAAIDAGPPPVVCGTWPARQLGATPETTALASDPARCGQPAFAWRDDSALGAVVETGAVQTFDASLIESLLALVPFTLPEPLAYDVGYRTFTYLTQDRGELIEATAAVAWPLGWTRAESPGTILMLHGTLGFADGCSASVDSGYRLLAAMLAARGYIVVMPDYLGLKASGAPTGFEHPYMVGQPTAIASLDALRALGQIAPADIGNLCPSSRFVVFGPSQGGQATMWVDRLQPYYASELEMAGAVAAVPPSDLVGQTTHGMLVMSGVTAVMSGVLTLAPTWYGYGDRLSEVFVSPWDANLPVDIAVDCGGGIDSDAIVAGGLGGLFQPAYLDAAAAGTLAEQMPFGCILAENSLTHTSVAPITRTDPSYGILYLLGENDDLVDPIVERASFDTLCAQGLPLQMLECVGAGHVEAVAYALPEILAFIDDRYAGTPMDAATLCTPQAATTCSATP